MIAAPGPRSGGSLCLPESPFAQAAETQLELGRPDLSFEQRTQGFEGVQLFSFACRTPVRSAQRKL